MSFIIIFLFSLLQNSWGQLIAPIKIYDAQFGPDFSATQKMGILVINNGKKASPFASQKAQTLYLNLKKTRDYFFNEFSRNGWDNKVLQFWPRSILPDIPSMITLE